MAHMITVHPIIHTRNGSASPWRSVVDNQRAEWIKTTTYYQPYRVQKPITPTHPTEAGRLTS